MRIGLDARALCGPYTGDRTYWRNLIKALAECDSPHDFILYSRTDLPPGDVPTNPRFRCHVVPASNERIWTAIALPKALKADNIDLIHVQYTSPPKMLCPCPVVTTVHDISFRLYPHWFPAKHRILMNLTVPVSMRSAAVVITDSYSSREDIQRVYHLHEEKLKAIPLGLTAAFSNLEPNSEETIQQCKLAIQLKYGISKPFILALGVLQPRKNLEMLAEAYGKLIAKYKVEHQLVFVGKAGWITGRENIVAAAARFGGDEAKGSVVFPGYAPDEELVSWYRACEIFAHPSLYEGFGIPPLEALACGAPVIVSDSPALPEVVGEAAILACATDSGIWAKQLYNMITDDGLRSRLRSAGPVRASRFSWIKAAQQTINVYESVNEKSALAT